MSEPFEKPLTGYFRLFQAADGSFVDMHETHGKLESRQNIPIALWLAARGERVRLLPVLRIPGTKCADATRDGVEWEFILVTKCIARREYGSSGLAGTRGLAQTRGAG